MDRRQGQATGQPAQALAAELATLRAGIVAVREAATERLPGMLASLLRVTDLAQARMVGTDAAVGELAGSLDRLAAAVGTLNARVTEVAAQIASDVLTGLLNRAALDRALEQAIAAAAATGEPLAVMFADVDHFKRFNDRWGHQAGDHALRLVASALNAYPDSRRIVGRYGGEEFVLAMPGRTAGDALFVAQTIADTLARRVLRARGTGERLGAVTLSAGVAQWRPGENAAALLRRADAAMYQAKRTGRNRVVLAR